MLSILEGGAVRAGTSGGRSLASVVPGGTGWSFEGPECVHRRVSSFVMGRVLPTHVSLFTGAVLLFVWFKEAELRRAAALVVACFLFLVGLAEAGARSTGMASLKGEGREGGRPLPPLAGQQRGSSALPLCLPLSVL